MVFVMIIVMMVLVICGYSVGYYHSDKQYKDISGVLLNVKKILHTNETLLLNLKSYVVVQPTAHKKDTVSSTRDNISNVVKENRKIVKEIERLEIDGSNE